MAVAQARVRQADAAAGQTEAAAGASLALDAQATRERYPEHSLYPPPIAGSARTSGHVALDFSCDFDFWGRNRSALDAALGRAAASRADAQAAAATLATGVAKTYFQWQAADQHLRIAQTIETQRQALVERQARRVRAGLAPGLRPRAAETPTPPRRARTSCSWRRSARRPSASCRRSSACTRCRRSHRCRCPRPPRCRTPTFASTCWRAAPRSLPRAIACRPR